MTIGTRAHHPRRIPLLHLLLMLALLGVSAPGAVPVQATGSTYFVRAGASGTTCISWDATEACDSFQDALAQAGSGDTIWIAAGRYYPDEGTGQSNDSRDATFQLVEGVNVYGGFPATGNPGLSDRDWETHVTVLSGDVDHETNPDTTTATGIVTDTAGIVGSNAYNVVIGADHATLDGFTITAGQAYGDYVDPCGPGCGGGMYNDGSSPALTNVAFSGNMSDYDGGAMANFNRADPTLTNVAFINNAASFSYGGGMYNNDSSPLLIAVTFEGNSTNTYGGGGGMSNHDNSHPTLTNVTFVNNQTDGYGGGGMSNHDNSRPTLTNVAFLENKAIGSGGKGGGMYNDGNSHATLTSVSFVSNKSTSLGGGLYNTGTSNPVLTNVSFVGNVGHSGGAIGNWGSSPVLTNVTMSGNTAASGNGGAIYNNNNYSNPLNLTLTNVTISGNRAANYGGAMYTSSFPDTSTLTIQNSIIWGNVAGVDGNQLSSSGTGGVTVSYSHSLIENSHSAGIGNLDGTSAANAPGFIAPLAASLAPTTAGDYRLQPGSPAIGVGDNSADTDADTAGVQPLPATDLGGDARIVGSTIDLGAYEVGPSLKFTKSVDNATPAPGALITYTLTMTNDGELDTSTALISDTLPTGLTFVPGSLKIDGAAQADPTLPTLAADVGVLTDTATVVTFQAGVDADLVAGTVITNTAGVTTGEDTTPVSSSAAVTVAAVPSLAVSVTPDMPSAEVGEEIRYTYRVTNTGNVTLSGVSAGDDDLGAVTLTGTSLAPDESTSGELNYTVRETDLPGPLTTSVTATGTSPTGDEQRGNGRHAHLHLLRDQHRQRHAQ